MSHFVLPDPRDLDDEGVNRVIQFCQANGIDPLKIPSPDGDPGFALRIHGDTIRFREYVFDDQGRVILGPDDKPRMTGWGERPLVAPAFTFGISLHKVRA